MMCVVVVDRHVLTQSPEQSRFYLSCVVIEIVVVVKMVNEMFVHMQCGGCG